jgi:hypothetical protein
MKNFRLLFKLLGVVAILAGLSSCKKDKDNSDCITCTYDGGKDTVCKSDGDWEEYADTWEDYVTFVKGIDAISDDISCSY